MGRGARGQPRGPVWRACVVEGGARSARDALARVRGYGGLALVEGGRRSRGSELDLLKH